MLFNSLEFLVFFPLVFFLYWFVFQKNFRVQNFLLLISSYVFYGWWDWRFLSLIAMSTLVDYIIGLKIYHSKEKSTKKLFLYVSIFFNLGLLGFFKYFNFFIDSWIDFLSMFGYVAQSQWTLKVILPVGISFYTFQTMSYSLDIYYDKLKPTKNFIAFASFVSFFPQLVAGPIERAKNLLPQILTSRNFKYEQGLQGLRLILWGFFKKVVIADSLAWRVDYCFENYQTLDGGVLLLGLIYFSFQIYCDFSGYSDIAIGTAKLFGIELMSNFRFPYFSRNIAEFWKRWHISLSSWFRDYLYIPLGGSKNGKLLAVRNVFIIFIVSGFWHGADWTFIIWGLNHALLYLPLFLFTKNRLYKGEIIAKNSSLLPIKDFFNVLFTYFLTTLSWVFFRSDSVSASFEYLLLLFTKFSIPDTLRSGMLPVIIILVFDWIMRSDERNPLNFKSKIFRWTVYTSIYIAILVSVDQNPTQFIYFQF